MARQEWTDERLNDFAAKFDGLPEQVAKLAEAVDHLSDTATGVRQDLDTIRTDVATQAERLRESLSTEIGGLRKELHDEHKDLRTEFNNLSRHMSQVGWTLVGILIVAVLGR